MERFIENFLFFDKGMKANLFYVIAALGIAGTSFTYGRVLNMPTAIYYPLIIILVWFLVSFFRVIEKAKVREVVKREKGIKRTTRKKRVKQNERVKRINPNLHFYDKMKLILIGIGTISILYYFTIPAGFSLVSTIYTNDKRIERFNCPITGLGTIRNRNYIYYDFMGSNHREKLEGSFFRELEENDNYKNYKVVLNAKRGLAETFILSDWNVEAL